MNIRKFIRKEVRRVMDTSYGTDMGEQLIEEYIWHAEDVIKENNDKANHLMDLINEPNAEDSVDEHWAHNELDKAGRNITTWKRSLNEAKKDEKKAKQLARQINKKEKELQKITKQSLAHKRNTSESKEFTKQKNQLNKELKKLGNEYDKIIIKYH